jgi:hypothetical protein
MLPSTVVTYREPPKEFELFLRSQNHWGRVENFISIYSLALYQTVEEHLTMLLDPANGVVPNPQGAGEIKRRCRPSRSRRRRRFPHLSHIFFRLNRIWFSPAFRDYKDGKGVPASVPDYMGAPRNLFRWKASKLTLRQRCLSLAARIVWAMMKVNGTKPIWRRGHEFPSLIPLVRGVYQNCFWFRVLRTLLEKIEIHFKAYYASRATFGPTLPQGRPS